MQLESPIPQTWSQWVYTVVAGILAISGWVATYLLRRQREPYEVAKLNAETAKAHAEARSIDTGTHTALVQAATDALAKAERTIDERNHWQRKAEALERQNDLLNIEVVSLDAQMRRLHGFIKAKGWSFSEFDAPKRND